MGTGWRWEFSGAIFLLGGLLVDVRLRGGSVEARAAKGPTSRKGREKWGTRLWKKTEFLLA
jgi:hypothetical protein